jgi:hypothetical protein
MTDLLSLGLGLVGLNADLRGGDINRDGGRGVVDLGGLGGACETRLDELDRAKEPGAAVELDRPRDLAPPSAAGNFNVGTGTIEDPGALGNSI